MEKKFAILRLTADNEDRLCIIPVIMENVSMAAAKRKVMKQFNNGTAAWVGWVDKYTLFDSVKA